MSTVTLMYYRILINDPLTLVVPEVVTGMIQLPMIQMCFRDPDVLPDTMSRLTTSFSSFHCRKC